MSADTECRSCKALVVATRAVSGGAVWLFNADGSPHACPPPFVRCPGRRHDLYATQDEFGKWWIPGICPACSQGAPL